MIIYFFKTCKNPSGVWMTQHYLLSTHSLWVLRLLQEGGELQHSQLGAGNTSALPRGGTGRHRQPCRAFITCRRENSESMNVWFERNNVKALKRKCSDIASYLSELFITSRVVSSLCRHDSPLSTQQGRKSTHLLWGPGRTLAWRNSAGRRA